MTKTVMFWGHFVHLFVTFGFAPAPAPKASPHIPNFQEDISPMFKKSWFYSKIFNLFHIIIVSMVTAEGSAAGR